MSGNRAAATLAIKAPSLSYTPPNLNKLDPLDRIIMDILAAVLPPPTKR